MNHRQGFLLVLVALAALAGGIALGRLWRAPAAAPATHGQTQDRKPLYYRNPMGLPDTSPVPKKDSMGMEYIPVYAEDAAAAAPGTVALTPERIQTLGVRTEPVRRQPLAQGVRAAATIGVDETRQFAIAPRFDGWVDTLQANQIGMAVQRGQPLLTVYSPQLLAAQEDYRVADTAVRALRPRDPDGAAAMQRLREAARRRLANFGISDAQLAHLAHRAPGNLAITAPASGVIVDKPIVAGTRFAAGDTILRLADLSTVWVTVNVPATQIGSVRLGQAARFTTPALPGRRFSGSVSFLQPTLDAATRTLGVRVALPNPEGQLRPGLFGLIELIGGDPTPVLTIPRSALIDSGTRQIVLVEVAAGRFAPRAVVIGRRTENAIEVLHGLTEGERVVVEGNFLIDAESNLRAALADLAAPAVPDDGPTDHADHAAGGGDQSRPASAANPDAAEHAGHSMPMPTAADEESRAGRAPEAPAPRPATDHAMDAHDMQQMEH